MSDAPTPTTSPPSTSALQRAAGSPWFWVAIVLVLFAIPLARTYVRSRQQPVPVLWPLPEWSLTNQDGQPFGARELRGHVYIANFIFTSCVLECPRLTREMSHLAPQLNEYGDRVHLVSISIDPRTDTPARLRSYMTTYHADPRRWTFVTGPEEDVMRAVTAGFRVDVDQPPRNADGTFNPVDLAHSNRFALVDAQGRLRGTYVAEPDGIQQLLHDLATVVAER